jgi:hypothetical protein
LIIVKEALAMIRKCLQPLLLVTALSYCSGNPSTGDGWIHETVIDGAVKTVRTVSGSVWGGTASLVEEASIGVVEGAEEFMLGRVRSLYVYDDRIYVLDSQVPVLRIYDLDGNHIQDIGKRGGGPGEFENPRSVILSPIDGTIYVRDGLQGRINRYTSGGLPLDTWPLTSGIQTGTQMVMSPDGNVYTPVYRIDFDADLFTKGMALMGPEGATVDTTYGPEFDFEEWEVEVRSEDGEQISIDLVPFSPEEMWVLCPSGSVVGGVSEDYRFEIHDSNGNIIVVEKSWDKVSVEPGESRWYRNRLIADFRNVLPGWAWNGRDIPRYKPAFAQFIPDHSERIWVRRHGPGIKIEDCDENPDDSSEFYRNPCWKETFTFDVFELNGRYLGRVEVPEGMEPRPEPYIKDNMMVALIQDDLGVQYVKRYRLVLPSTEDK